MGEPVIHLADNVQPKGYIRPDYTYTRPTHEKLKLSLFNSTALTIYNEP
jgi:hypothetical protein